MVLAGLVVVVVALVGLLVLVAFVPVMRIQLNLLAAAAESGIPLIGGALGWLIRKQDELIASAYAKTVAWAVSSVGPLVAVIFWPVHMYDQHQQGAQSSAVNTLYALQRIVSVVIPAGVQRAMQFAWDVGQNVSHYAEALAQQARQFAWDVGQNVSHYAEALTARAVSYSEELFNRATAYTRSLTAQLQAYTEDLFNRATAYTRALVADAEALALRYRSEAIGFAEDAFGRAIDFERRLYGDALDFTRRLARESNDYSRALHDLATAFTVTSVGAVLTRVITLERSPCIQKCIPLGNLGADLEELENLFAAGALFALAAEAARDPRGWARDLVADLVEPAQEAAGAVLGEVGL